MTHRNFCCMFVLRLLQIFPCIRCSLSVLMVSMTAEDRLRLLHRTVQYMFNKTRNCIYIHIYIYINIKNIHVFHFISVSLRTRNLQHALIVIQRRQEDMFFLEYIQLISMMFQFTLIENHFSFKKNVFT